MKANILTHKPHAQPYWDARAAANFICGGTGTGLLLFAALETARGRSFIVPGVVALAFIALGLSMVFLEIGRPERAPFVILRPGTSWMSREALTSIPLFGFGLLAILGSLPIGARFGIPVVPTAGIAALAGLVFLYCQSRMVSWGRGIPAWREPLSVPLMFTSGLSEGAGAMLIVTALVAEPALWVIAAAGVLVILRSLVWKRYLQRLHDGKVPEASIQALDRISVYVTLGGGALPIFLLVIAAVTIQSRAPAAALAGLCALGAGWLAKLVLITKAGVTQGFALPVTPVRGGRFDAA